MPNMPTVAVLGTGLMGRPMAENLLRAGADVRAWNRTRSKAAPLEQAGATVCASPAEAAAGADVLLTMLMDADAVVDAVAGSGAALGALPDHGLWLQMSTVGVDGCDRLARLAHEHGVSFVDAPVLGTRKPAEDGTLSILASGPEDVHARSEQVFAPIGRLFRWLGDAGAGTRLKLVANAWVLNMTDALATSIRLSRALDLDPQLFLDVIDGSASDSAYAHLRGPAMIDGSYPASFSLDGAAKDANLIIDAGRAAGYHPQLVQTVSDHLQRAVERGHGPDDMAAVYTAHED